MNPSKHARSLYFTPRTPWGRLPQNRPGQSQNYLRASQDAPANSDKKLDPSGKDMQGLAGGMASNQFGGSGGSERSMDKNGVPLGLRSQLPQEQSRAPKELSCQLPLPEQKPLVSQQDLANERWHAELKHKIEENRKYGAEGTHGMTWDERNRYNSTFSGVENEKADGQLGDHVAVGAEYSKIFGLGEKGDLNGGIIVRSNPGVPFQPLETKDANADYYEKMRSSRAPDSKAMLDFYRKKP